MSIKAQRWDFQHQRGQTREEAEAVEGAEARGSEKRGMRKTEAGDVRIRVEIARRREHKMKYLQHKCANVDVEGVCISRQYA